VRHWKLILLIQLCCIAPGAPVPAVNVLAFITCNDGIAVVAGNDENEEEGT
jgi:hypothetical protein